MCRRNTGFLDWFGTVGSLAVLAGLFYIVAIGSVGYIVWHFASKWW